MGSHKCAKTDIVLASVSIVTKTKQEKIESCIKMKCSVSILSLSTLSLAHWIVCSMVAGKDFSVQ